MPRGEVETVDVINEVFREILHRKKSSIRKLGQEPSVDCSEKTIRRELKEKGGLRQQYVDRIARYLDVDPRLLTGELVKAAFETEDGEKRRQLLYPLEHLERFPYFREEQSRIRMEGIDQTIRRILSLFEISYSQFEEKNFEDQYSFQHDMIVALMPVMYEHFDRDGYGNKERRSFEKALHDLESYREDYYFWRYLNITRRKELAQNPPHGYTSKQIQKMDLKELEALDLELQWTENSTEKTDDT